MVLADNLKALRRRRALTQQELADRAGINRVTVSRLESGTDQPVPATVRRLASALDVPIDDLTGTGTLPDVPSAQGEALIARIRAEGIAVPDDERSDVARLASTGELAALITEAADEIRKAFGDARLELRFVVDPDEDDEGLQLLIRSDLKYPDAHETLRRFDYAWWLDNIWRSDALLLIDVR